MRRLLGWTLGIGSVLALGATPTMAQTHVTVGVGVATPYGGGTVVIGRPAYPYPYRAPYAYRYPYPVYYPPAYPAPVYQYPYRAYYPAYPYYGPAYGGAVIVGGGYRGYGYGHPGYGHGHGNGSHGGGHGHGHH